MIQLIKTILIQFINDIDSGNTNINEDQQKELLSLIQRFNQKEFSKTEAANYIGVSRATFDNYINNGWIPKGQKRQGFKELSWNKIDLDNYLNNIKNKK